ncbi:MAG: MFS transporter [Chloroflexi bacterium]|nr:MFS transporter [Chloroflexota bacterium]
MKNRKGLSVLAAVLVLVTFLDLFTQLPTTAPYAKSLGAAEAMIGLLVAAYSVTNLAGNLLAGQMLDRWGRKQALYLGLVGTAVALLLYTRAQSPAGLLLVRLFHGFTAGFLSPAAFTIIADLAPPQGRTRAMGLAGAYVGIAAIVGPASAGALRARWGFNAVFITVAGLMVLALVVSLLLLRGDMKRNPVREEAKTPFPLRPLVAPCLGVFALTFTMGVLTAYLPLSLEAAGYGRAVPGIMLSVFSLAAVVVMASPFGRLSDRWGRIRTMSAGLLGVGAGLLVLAAARAMPAVGLAMIIYGMSYGLIFPTSTAAVADAAGMGQRGRAFAAFYAVFSLGVTAGAIASGLLSRPDWGDGLPYYAGAAAAVGGAVVLTRLGQARRRGGP